MAEYLILIYGDEAALDNPDPGSFDQMMKGHQVFGERNASALRGGNALQSTATATVGAPGRLGGVRGDRRSVRGDQGGARRLLPGRGSGPGRGPRVGQAGADARRRGRGPADQDVQLTDAHRLVNASVEAAVADAHRREWGFVLAATVRVTGDIDLAEECVQDAYARALATWSTGGIPSKPGAWLTTVARRRAIDVARRERTHDRRCPCWSNR